MEEPLPGGHEQLVEHEKTAEHFDNIYAFLKTRVKAELKELRRFEVKHGLTFYELEPVYFSV